MPDDDTPARSVSIVLVGGGHAHAVALACGLAAGRDTDIVLVAPDRFAPYSGMIPGAIAGRYRTEEAHVDLVGLCAARGVRLVTGRAAGIDRAGRRLLLEDGAPIPFDLLSVNIGITPDVSAIAGAGHATTIKPIDGLIGRIEALNQQGRPGHLAVVGGGAGGVEVAFALRNGLAGSRVTLVMRDGLLPGHGRLARHLIRRALVRQDIATIDRFTVARVEPDRLVAADGRYLTSDTVLLNTGASPAEWFPATGLALDAGGFLAVGPTLQVLGEQHVFAAGDCAGMVQTPRPKAGVYAVRQGRVIAANLMEASAALRAGRAARLMTYRPQARALAILSTGDGRAVASWGPLAASGRWVWWWKDRIDRRFMDDLAAAGQPRSKS
ncbi:FAD-dependent oxidoreductase [Phreatobacter sp.]|uniref:FAD-dependent oxidoreductase n=1 Tax=Phreatobacter sp. TaxID=1966341 RepID=UPI003F70A542